MRNLTVMLLLGLVYLSGTAEAGETEPCLEKKHIVDQTLCLGKKAVTNGDWIVCDASEHPGVRFQCYYIFARKTGKLNVCDRIPDQSLKDGCYSDVALKTGPATCEKILTPGIRDSCYFKLVRQNNAQDLCEKIQDPGLKSGCTGTPLTD